MRTIKGLNLNEKEINKLKNMIANIDVVETIKKECMVILDYNEGKNINNIITHTNYCKKTIYNIINEYKKNPNFFGLKENFSKLTQKKQIIDKNFTEYPVKSYRIAQKRIKRICCFNKLSLSNVHNFMKKENYKINIDGFYTKNGKPNKSLPNKELQENYDKIMDYIEVNKELNWEKLRSNIENTFQNIPLKDGELNIFQNFYINIH